MGTAALIAIVAGGCALVVAAALLVSRGQGRGGKARCGRCRRVMMADWQRCLFCGWEPPAPGARLEFVYGPVAGDVLELADEITTLGSVAGNTVVLADPGVSRKHVGIRRTPDGFELADLGSTNGVYVNGRREAKVQLAAGDIVRVGNTEMVFRIE